MRVTLNKKNSTRAERVFAQALRELRISFQHRVYIEGREIDFLLNAGGKNLCIEIDGHGQDSKKNQRLVELGYTPIHLSNSQITDLKSIKEYVYKLVR